MDALLRKTCNIDPSANMIGTLFVRPFYSWSCTTGLNVSHVGAGVVHDLYCNRPVDSVCCSLGLDKKVNKTGDWCGGRFTCHMCLSWDGETRRQGARLEILFVCDVTTLPVVAMSTVFPE
jgi:hypothetical protein